MIAGCGHEGGADGEFLHSRETRRLHLDRFTLGHTLGSCAIPTIFAQHTKGFMLYSHLARGKGQIPWHELMVVALLIQVGFVLEYRFM